MGKNKGIVAPADTVQRTIKKHVPRRADSKQKRPGLAITETWQEGPTTRKRVRIVAESDAAAGLKNLADAYGDANESAKMRRQPAPRRRARNPAQENRKGEAIHTSYLPEFWWEATLVENSKNQHLRWLIDRQWLPMVWSHFERAGLPTGALVFFQDPATGHFSKRGAKAKKPTLQEFPAWRLPALYRSELGSPEDIAGELLYVSCALAEAIDSSAPRLRARFADNPEDLASLSPVILAARGAELFGTLSMLAPWDEHPFKMPMLTAARKYAASVRDLPEEILQLVPLLREAHDSGGIGSHNDYVRIIQANLPSNDFGSAKKIANRLRDIAAIVTVRGWAGRKKR